MLLSFFSQIAVEIVIEVHCPSSYRTDSRIRWQDLQEMHNWQISVVMMEHLQLSLILWGVGPPRLSPWDPRLTEKSPSCCLSWRWDWRWLVRRLVFIHGFTLNYQRTSTMRSTSTTTRDTSSISLHFARFCKFFFQDAVTLVQIIRNWWNFVQVLQIYSIDGGINIKLIT